MSGECVKLDVLSSPSGRTCFLLCSMSCSEPGKSDGKWFEHMSYCRSKRMKSERKGWEKRATFFSCPFGEEEEGFHMTHIILSLRSALSDHLLSHVGQTVKGLKGNCPPVCLWHTTRKSVLFSIMDRSWERIFQEIVSWFACVTFQALICLHFLLIMNEVRDRLLACGTYERPFAFTCFKKLDERFFFFSGLWTWRGMFEASFSILSVSQTWNGYLVRKPGLKNGWTEQMLQKIH